MNPHRASRVRLHSTPAVLRKAHRRTEPLNTHRPQYAILTWHERIMRTVQILRFRKDLLGFLAGVVITLLGMRLTQWWQTKARVRRKNAP